MKSLSFAVIKSWFAPRQSVKSGDSSVLGSNPSGSLAEIPLPKVSLALSASSGQDLSVNTQPKMPATLASADNSLPTDFSVPENKLGTSHNHSNLREISWSTQEPIVPTEQFLAPGPIPATSENCSNGTTQSEEISPKNVVRGEHGKLQPGSVLNPLGRPRTTMISQAYREILRRDGPEKYAEVVAKDAIESARARDRLAAIQEMTDRMEGKATQKTDVRGMFMVLAPEAGNLARMDAWADDE